MHKRLDPKLIQLACDGELSPEQSAQLNQHIANQPEAAAELQQSINTSGALRSAVDRSMRESCPAAPLDLAHNIRKVMAANRPRPVARPRQVLRFMFAEPRRANLLAVAATIAVIAGAVLFGIYGRTIDEAAAPTVDLVSDAAVFADQEHRVVAREANQIMPMVAADPAEVEIALSQRLGTPVEVFDLSAAGYEFIGSPQSDMPVPARSAHLLYRRITTDGSQAPMLSVFIVRNEGKCRGKLCEGLDRGKWCCVGDRGVKCKHKVLRGTDGRLVYFLVCCVDGDLDKVTERIQLASAASPSP